MKKFLVLLLCGLLFAGDVYAAVSPTPAPAPTQAPATPQHLPGHIETQ